MSEKRPFISRAQAEEIAARFPTPFHIYDEAGIRRSARALNEAFSWNRGFREFFAVKATPNPAILSILKEEGCGVDCSSVTELMLAEACGFSGHEIMFSSNETPASEFTRANRLGGIINLDDLTLIDTLLEGCGSVPETICCRFNPGGEFEIGNFIMDHPKDAKYGMTAEQMEEAFRRLSALGAKRFGIHAFLASNALTDEYYPVLAEILFRLAVRLRDATGVRFSFINLSGGVGVDYRPGDRACDIAAVGAGVRRAYEKILVPAGMGDVSIYTELGRWMLASHGALVTRATHEKHIYKEYIGVDACACDLMRPAMYGAYHHITVLGKEDAPRDRVYDVVGSLCENNDKFAVDRELPAIERGDLLYIHDTGAHGHSMGYNYNGKLRSAELLLQEDGGVRLIRRAETPADYFATLDVLGMDLC